MSQRWREVIVCVAVIAVAAIVWLPTLGWGLPSRATDRQLFGNRTPWTGREILALTNAAAATKPADRGADVDADPILDRSQPVVLNDTDAKRAAIVRRYRLMSGQPDEFIQFKALAEMSQRSGWNKLDPRLYQYGGLWIYPVGGLIRIAMAVGIIDRPPAGVPAMEFYLDHPEAFGRFYVVARAYSAFWGFVALAAIYVLTRRATGTVMFAAVACVLFTTLPVVRTATHEAKPHLAGAALCLWAVIAAGRYVESGRCRWLLLAGALCGASMAMVVSMLLSIVVLPTAWWIRRSRLLSTPARRPTIVAAIAALMCAGVVYAITNPFVLINALSHRDLLRSNFGNSTAMYGVGGVFATITSATRIAIAGLGWTTLVSIALAVAILLIKRPRSEAIMLPLLVVALASLVQFIALAAGKPAEYARFGLFWMGAAVALVGLALGQMAAIRDGRTFANVVASLLIASRAGALLLENRCRCTSPERDWANRREAYFAEAKTGTTQPVRFLPHRLAVAYEPAPWSLPPFDLFDTEIVLVPRAWPGLGDADAFIYPANLSSQLNRLPHAEECDWQRDAPFEIEWRDGGGDVSSTPARPGSGPAE